jgi:hypothetical protein
MTTITYEDFERVDIRVGTIVEAASLEGARKPAYRLLIDFGGEVGTKKSSAQITVHYAPEDLIGRQVAGGRELPAAPDRQVHVRSPDARLPGRRRQRRADRADQAGAERRQAVLATTPSARAERSEVEGPLFASTRRASENRSLDCAALRATSLGTTGTCLEDPVDPAMRIGRAAALDADEGGLQFLGLRARAAVCRS